MNKFVFGASMFGLGALSAYFVTKKYLGDQYREDLAEVQAFYREKLVELGVMESGFEARERYSGQSDDEEEGDSDTQEEDEDDEVVGIYQGKGRHFADYTKYSKPSMESLLNGANHPLVTAIKEEPYEPSPDPEYEAEIQARAEDFARRKAENQEKGEPYLIDADEYHDMDDNDVYDKQVLYYYTHDRVLCEDNDEVVDDDEECVGLDYEDILDMQTTAWVRNDKLGMLYEIHRVDDAYKKAVLGVVETPREREFRIQSRRKQALDD